MHSWICFVNCLIANIATIGYTSFFVEQVRKILFRYIPALVTLDMHAINPSTSEVLAYSRGRVRAVTASGASVGRVFGLLESMGAFGIRGFNGLLTDFTELGNADRCVIRFNLSTEIASVMLAVQRCIPVHTDDIFPNVVAVKALHVGAGADESKVFLIGVVAFAFFGGMGRLRQSEKQSKYDNSQNKQFLIHSDRSFHLAEKTFSVFPL